MDEKEKQLKPNKKKVKWFNGKKKTFIPRKYRKS